MVVDGIVANRTVPVRVAYKDVPLDITPETEVVRYLGFWATPNGNMQTAMQLVMDRTLRAKETIQGHPLGPKQAVEIFAAKAVGNFRYLRQHRGNGETWIDWTDTGDRGIKQCGS